MRITIAVLHFAALASTLLVMAVAIDTSCVNDDLEFTEASKKDHDVTKLHCGYDSCSVGKLESRLEPVQVRKRLEEQSKKCQKICQDADPRIGACTHFSSYVIQIRADAYVSVNGVPQRHSYLPSCKLYNGRMEYRKYVDAGRFAIKWGDARITTLRTGPAFCDGDKKKIQRKATAKWVVVAGPCINEDARGNVICKYRETVGIGKSNSNTKSSSTTAATEFSLTIGTSVTASDPLGVLEATSSMEASMGFSHSWSNEQSRTFKQNASTSKTHEVSIEVEPGQVSTVCQPQGQVGNFVIYSSTFKRVSGYSCDNASDDSPDA